MTSEGVTSERPAQSAEPRAPANRARLKAAAVLAAVFVLGGLAGGAAGRISAQHELRHMMEGPPDQARANFHLEAMRRHLDLTDDQVGKVRAVLSEADADRDKLMASCGPGLDDLRTRTDARLREILTEEQRKRFDKLHRGKRPWGPPPGAPPGPPPPR